MSDVAERLCPWLRSAAWDGFWMLSGLWLIVPVLGFSRLPGALNGLLIISSLLLWLAHRFATTFTAFCTPAYRGLVREQSARFLVLPALIFILVFGFVFTPEAVIRLDNWAKIQVLGTIFFLYNTYHFGVQHYGVLSIYRGRAGQSSSTGFKRYEKAFCLLVGGVVVAVAQIGHGAEVVQDSLVYKIVERESLGAAFQNFQLAAPVLVLVAAAVFYFHELKEEHPSSPKMLYVAGVAFQAILAWFLEPLPFLILWGVQHWLVSVALAGHMAENDTSPVPESSLWYRFWSPFSRGFWMAVLVLSLASLVLAPLFEYSVHPAKINGGPAFLAFLGPLLEKESLVHLFIALSFATVFLHFVMDRAIFRFSDAAVRNVTLPLLFRRAG